MESKNKKLREATKNLNQALKQYKQSKNELNFITVVKTFEVAIEYAWREMKRVVEDQGLEAPSPKIAIKQAAKIGCLSQPELWLECIDARNSSVHDYFGITEEEYVQLADHLLRLLQEIQI